MPATPTLYTPRLTLRPFDLADAGRVQELAGDPRVAATTACIPHPYPAGLADDWIRIHGTLAQENREHHFAITLAGTRTPGREADLHDTGHLIGSISLILAQADPSAELGYWIGVPYWNRGFATEAGHAALAFGFQRRDLRQIVANHVFNNPASGRVLQKLGMTPRGTLRAGFAKGSQLLDLECYAIDRANWSRARLRPRFPAPSALQPA